MHGHRKHNIVLFTENEMRPSKKRTRSLRSNMVEVHRCFGVALLLLAPDGLTVCVHGIMKSEDYQLIVGRRHPSNLRHLEQLAKEEGSKMAVERCKKLIDGYRKRLISVIFSKGCATKY